MTADDDTDFVPGDEVDEWVWMSLDDARGRLSYEHDVPVLDRLPVA
jgi:hypothetical protein